MDSRFFSSRENVLILSILSAKPKVGDEEADQSANHGDVAKPLQRALPQLDGPGNMRIFRQSAVKFRLGGVMQHVDHASAANTLRIVNSCMREVGMIAKLLCATL